jgi:hypothetical protein
MKGIGDASKGEFTKFEAKRVPKRRHRWHAVQV